MLGFYPIWLCAILHPICAAALLHPKDTLLVVIPCLWLLESVCPLFLNDPWTFAGESVILTFYLGLNIPQYLILFILTVFITSTIIRKLLWWRLIDAPVLRQNNMPIGVCLILWIHSKVIIGSTHSPFQDYGCQPVAFRHTVFVRTMNRQKEHMKLNIHFSLTQQRLECCQDESSVNLRVVTMSLRPSVTMDTGDLKVIGQIKAACSEKDAQSIVPRL